MKVKKQQSNKKILLGIIFTIIVMFVTYSYAIASTTFSVSDMKDKKYKIDELQTEIAELEYEYFSIISNISIDSVDVDLSDVNVVGYASLDDSLRVAYNY